MKTGYITKNNSALAGLVFRYEFSEHVRVAPQIGVVFRHENLDALTIDADVHFPFKACSGRLSFYPLAGLAFNSWNHHDEGHGTSSHSDCDVTRHTNALGLNGGAGVDIYCTESMRIGFEARYTLIQHKPNGQISASIAYVF